LNKLFLTGMARSGTTLLDKLLSCHPDVHILSQPFPYLFIDAIKKFLQTQGIEKYYVMNDEIKSHLYKPEDFECFLSHYRSTGAEIRDRFAAMQNYSGQYTKPSRSLWNSNREISSFHQLYQEALALFGVDNRLKYIGSKETVCEAFIPYLCRNGVKTILIVRDPRDVLASMNYAMGSKYAGTKKPALFILRTWRKSFEYLYRLKDEGNFLFICYEDLVRTTDITLKKITKFLEIPSFEVGQFEHDIIDQNGKKWHANSSFHKQKNGISSASIGIYKTQLSDQETEYVDVICGKEMRWLGYNPGEVSDPERVLRTYRDYEVVSSYEVSAGYSSQHDNIENEVAWLHGRL
jgi:Sulfotransferase family